MASYGEFAYYYDGLTDNVDYEKRCDYIRGLLAENGIGEGILLDLACGTGTVSLMLSRMGYDVIGVDGSEDMLSVAQEKKMETEEDVIFLCQKMEELDLFGTINAAVSTLDSINHVTDADTPYKHREVLGNNTFVYDTDEVYCVWQNSTDESLLTTISLDIFEKDEDDDETYYRYSEEFDERAYDLGDIRKWLEECKFEVTAVYEEMTCKAVSEKTQRAVFVARKIGTQ